MTGVVNGSGGTGVLEGSRPGTGISGVTLSPYDQAVLALGPNVYFADMTAGPFVPADSYDTVITGLGPNVYFADMEIY